MAALGEPPVHAPADAAHPTQSLDPGPASHEAGSVDLALEFDEVDVPLDLDLDTGPDPQWQPTV